jgi:hypothetical protein
LWISVCNLTNWPSLQVNDRFLKPRWILLIQMSELRENYLMFQGSSKARWGICANLLRCP